MRSSRGLLALLLLAGLALVTLDARGGRDSPVEPLRSAVGAVLGPVESGTAALARPFQDIGGFFHSNVSLREDLARARAENSRLRSRLARTALDRNRAAELDGLLDAARTTGYALVPARVVAVGPAQSFSQTVTIDAGTSAGVHEDMTVVDDDGLVGRVVRATRSTATVLLIVDRDSVVGSRLAASMELGFLRGRGGLDGDARLDLQLVDSTAQAGRHDVLVTWGSEKGTPYVAGIPIGTVTSVRTSPREQSEHAVIRPFVDFSSLDVVGVVVDPSESGDRGLVTADGPERAGTGRR